MKIYTKTGDKGETSLVGGMRVPKDSLRVETYGTVDELNSVLGVCRAMNYEVPEVDVILEELQHDLLTVIGDLAAPEKETLPTIKRVQAADVERLEKHIDTIDVKLKPLQGFILPGGNKTAAFLHLAGTVCRRAERLVVRLSKQEHIGEQLIIYLNRLSDLLFVMARWVNAMSNTSETKWKK